MFREWKIIFLLGMVFTASIFPSGIFAQSSRETVQPQISSRKLSKVNQRPTDQVPVERIEALYNLLGSSFDDPILLNNLGVHYSTLNRHKKAAEVIGKAVELAPESPAIRLNLVVAKTNLGELSSALEFLEQARSLDPTNPRIDPLLCDLLSGTLRHGDAVECFERRLKSSTLDFASASNYAHSLIFEGRSKEAARILRKASARYPNNKAIMNGLGMALYEMKKYSESAEVLQQLVETNPRQGEFRYNLTMAQLALNKRAAALQNYAILKRAQPELAKRLYKEIFRDRVVDVSER